MATLTLHSLNLTYPDGTHAVREVDLTVAEGEFCVFLGPSGCGKTSTLRMIAGLQLPTGGAIRLDGRDITRLYPGERDIAMVFQSYALYPHLTVRDHFEFPLRARKVAKAERQRRVAAIAELLRMTDRLEARPRQLSGGEAQRTAIGRALIRQPKLFLLDEPLTNLDAKLRLETRAALKRLQSELGITTIYVTHDQEEALSLADRIVIMHDGRVQQVADARELYGQPVNLFVAGFVGTPPMNFVPVTLRRNGSGVILETSDFRLPLAPPLAEAMSHLPPDAALILGARPEDLGIGPPPKTPEEPQGRVVVVEPQGDERIVSVVLGSGSDGAAATDPIWKVRAPRLGGAEALAPGQVVGLTIRPPGLRLFDAATEARVV
jgi:multiple sugar transport system ATP-binding protein